MRNMRAFGIMILVYFSLGAGVSRASGIVLVFQDYENGGSGTTISTTPLITTGATLIVVGCAGVGAVSSITNSGTADSWTLLTAYGVSGSGANYAQLGYAYSPTTSSSGQTFTCTWSTSQDDSSMMALGFSGTMTTSAVLDASTGSSDSTSTSIFTGTITPSVTGEEIVALTSNGLDTTFACNNVTFSQSWNEIVDCGNYENNTAVLWLLDPTTSAFNDTLDWVSSSGTNTSVAMAAFKPSGGKRRVLGNQQ